MIFNSPYPHIKEDNFLNNNLLDKIKYFWPDNNLFFDEIPGIRLLDLHYSTNTETRLKKKLKNFLEGKKKLSGDQLIFWKDLLSNQINEINERVFEIFKDKLFNKFKTDTSPKILHLNLMQASNKFVGHGVHNHHYHNPNWSYTILIYIDDESNEAPGTDIYEIIKPNDTNILDYLTKYSIEHKMPVLDHKIKITKTIDFKSNRLFAFLDTPISYHGVNKKNSKNKIDNTYRKILRLHCGYDDDSIKKIYNMNLSKYKKIRKKNAIHNLINPENKIYRGIKHELNIFYNNE